MGLSFANANLFSLSTAVMDIEASSYANTDINSFFS